MTDIPAETAIEYCYKIGDYPSKADCNKCKECAVDPFGTQWTDEY